MKEKIFLWVFALASLCVNQALAQESVPAPVVRVGDSCTHVKRVQGQDLQPITQRVVQVNTQDFKAEASLSSGMIIETWTFTLDGNPKQRENRLGKTTWEPYQPLYKWPAKVGDEWRGGYSYPPRGGGNGKIDLVAKVESRETITVPAGTFETIKIVLKGEYVETTPNGIGSGRREEVIWYGVTVPCLVKATLKAYRWDGTPLPEEVRELTAYQLTK